MIRDPIARRLALPLLTLALAASGCGAGGSYTPTAGHDGLSATGHAGGTPAGGAGAPTGKDAAKAGGAANRRSAGPQPGPPRR